MSLVEHRHGGAQVDLDLLAATVLARRLGAAHARDHALAQQIPLELGEGGQHVQHEPPAGGGRVDARVSGRDELDAPPGEAVEGPQKMR